MLVKLPARLRGYASWLPKTWRIVVVVDRDDEDCKELKAKLERIARDAGLVTRSRIDGTSCSVVNRLAIEELEAWYFGDWAAVRAAFPRVPERRLRHALARKAACAPGSRPFLPIVQSIARQVQEDVATLRTLGLAIPAEHG